MKSLEVIAPQVHASIACSTLELVSVEKAPLAERQGPAEDV